MRHPNPLQMTSLCFVLLLSLSLSLISLPHLSIRYQVKFGHDFEHRKRGKGDEEEAREAICSDVLSKKALQCPGQSQSPIEDRYSLNQKIRLGSSWLTGCVLIKQVGQFIGNIIGNIALSMIPNSANVQRVGFTNYKWDLFIVFLMRRASS